MEYVTLSNGVKMPILGYGVYQLRMNVKDVLLMLLKLDTEQLIQHRVISTRKRLVMQLKNQEYQEKKFSSQQRYGLSIMDMKKLRSQFLSL